MNPVTPILTTFRYAVFVFGYFNIVTASIVSNEMMRPFINDYFIVSISSVYSMPISATNMYLVPYTFDVLIKPYMQL